ncbi:MAG: stage II sporulation protein P [Syntrophomonadaceae bacterium]|nr:stage II sporulation protein P [Syntrophomonadaceae bacterium]
MNSAKKILGILFVVAGILCLAYVTDLKPAVSLTGVPLELGVYELERTDGGYYTILDSQGKILDKTIRRVFPGDEFISEDNRLYRVTKIDGNSAYADFKKDVELPVFHGMNYGASVREDGTVEVQAGARNVIAMYNTHTAESYVPTDGTDSIPGAGGIFKVSDALAQKLKELGVRVAYYKTIHEPHDANAYRRSRRTAAKLLSQYQPAAIIDIHRDGVPDPDFYRGHIHGMDVTRLRLVVGRQNQNMQSNLDFAKQIKAVNDRINPGLIRGIFIARGNYNQDLSPRSILIEVGTHTNERWKAEQGAVLFAKSLPQVLGIGRQPEGVVGPIAENRGDWSGIMWVLAVLLIGAGAFLVISTGSFQGALNKLKTFTTIEWTNFLGKRRSRISEKNKKDGDS